MSTIDSDVPLEEYLNKLQKQVNILDGKVHALESMCTLYNWIIVAKLGVDKTPIDQFLRDKIAGNNRIASDDRFAESVFVRQFMDGANQLLQTLLGEDGGDDGLKRKLNLFVIDGGKTD